MHVDQEHCVQRSAGLKLKCSTALLISCSLANKVTLRSRLPNRYNRTFFVVVSIYQFQIYDTSSTDFNISPLHLTLCRKPVAHGESIVYKEVLDSN